MGLGDHAYLDREHAVHRMTSRGGVFVALAARRDRGAVATIVAAFFGSMVILGCAAIAIDWGSIMWERRQVQNGADSASLAMAQQCAKNPASCLTAALTQTGAGQIGALNNAMAKDGRNGYNTLVYADNGTCLNALARSEVVAAVGSAIGVPPLCTVTPALNDLKNCPPLKASLATDPTVRYVEVRTRTSTTSGSTLLPPFVAQAIGYGGSDFIQSCARAAWRPHSTSPGTIPFTISVCEWEDGVLNGNVNGNGTPLAPPDGTGAWSVGMFGPAPWYTTGWPSGVHEITLTINKPNGQGHGNPSDCYNFNGHDLPGGFGFLEHVPSQPCVVQPYPPAAPGVTQDWYHADPGASVDCDLSTLVGSVVKIPIFDCTLDAPIPALGGYPPGTPDCIDTANGSKAYYHASNGAYFFVTGYDATVTSSATNKVRSIYSHNFPNCPGGYKCITGWFVTGVSNNGGGGGGAFGNLSVGEAG